ncbi:MAG: tRNA-guanine transglycosylase, partial [Solirubrobacteraceae bacterium]
IKGRRGRKGQDGPAGSKSHARIESIEEDGVAFRSYVDGSRQFLSPERSMEVQAALGTDLAVVFDECTPFNVERDYTARSTERTHRWLERCLRWHEQHAPGWQLVYGIVQGGVYDDLRREACQIVAGSRADAIAIGGSLGSHKAQMYEVVDWSTAELHRVAPQKPRHLLGIGDIDDLIRGVELGIDTFDCAMPTRIARHGMVLVPDPERRWRVDLTQARWKTSDEPLCDGCPCPACAHGFSRGYLHYLLRHRELTGMRLATQHNLAFVARTMAGLRQAIVDGRLADEAAELRGGRLP